MTSKKSKKPLGIRLNNPANIRRSSARWYGLSKVQSNPNFCEFIDNICGVRALFVLLRTYCNRYKLVSVRDVISRYAPSSENDTEAYINYVEDYCKDCCLYPEFANDWSTDTGIPFSVYILAKAICKMETGFLMSYELYEFIDVTYFK